MALTYAYSAAAKRRAKKGRTMAEQFALEPTKTAKQPREGGRFVRAQEDAAAAPLASRCTRAGIEDTDANRRDMRAPWNGCAAGIAMAEQVKDADERTTLWSAICHMRKVQAAYDAAIGAPKRHATCLRLLLPVEAMEADAASPAPDARSPEDRARAATSAHMAVQGWLDHTDKQAASQARRSVIDDLPVKDAEGLILALRCVADGLAGRRMVCRSRLAATH